MSDGLRTGKKTVIVIGFVCVLCAGVAIGLILARPFAPGPGAATAGTACAGVDGPSTLWVKVRK